MNNNMEEFMIKLAECLDRQIINESDKLAEFPEWDSLSILSIIATIDSSYGVNLTARQLQEIETAGDLWKMIVSRKK
jgi:acyl carrier protein